MCPLKNRKKLAKLVDDISNNVIDWRRDFHQHPELSNREKRTAQKIKEILNDLGVDAVKTGIARHGVVAEIQGDSSGPCVALRADMDALPIAEEVELPFQSQNKGIMHACGHDCHAAILLGVAHILVRLKDEINGTVKLIFQPCEEGTPDGEESGALLMIRQGVLEKPDVSAIFALHIDPLLETGKISFTPGGSSAAVDILNIEVKGKQTHAAYPWDGIDPIVAASHIVLALQTIVSRRLDIRETAVLSICEFNAGMRWNVIPNTVEMTGTIRTHNEEVRESIKKWCEKILYQTASAHDVVAKIDFYDYGPALINNEALTEFSRPYLRDIVGEENVGILPPTMGGEDFAYFAKEIPAFYFNLGVHDPKSSSRCNLHSPKLLVDEAALSFGTESLSLLALEYLDQGQR